MQHWVWAWCLEYTNDDPPINIHIKYSLLDPHVLGFALYSYMFELIIHTKQNTLRRLWHNYTSEMMNRFEMLTPTLTYGDNVACEWEIWILCVLVRCCKSIWRSCLVLLEMFKGIFLILIRFAGNSGAVIYRAYIVGAEEPNDWFRNLFTLFKTQIVIFTSHIFWKPQM